MKEDIKILLKNLKTEKEKWIDKIYGVGETRIDLMIDDVIKALENLIKGYRELEEENNKFRNGDIITPKLEAKTRKAIFNDLKNYIPKSKIKEKIEEIKGRKMDIVTSPVHNCDEKLEILKKDKIRIEVLQELLGDE